MYTITFTTEAKRFLKKLVKNDARRIIASLERCKVRPHTHVKKLIGTPYFWLRVGDYRIIMKIIDGELTIIVVKIAHRKNSYK